VSLDLGRRISPNIHVDPDNTESFREKCLYYDVIFYNCSIYLFADSLDKMVLSLKENL